MDPALLKVKRAAAARVAAEEQFKAAIIEARESHTMPEIAKAAGVSKQRIHQVLHRSR